MRDKTYKSEQLKVAKEKLICIYDKKSEETLQDTGKPLSIYSLYHKILPEKYKDIGELGISYSTFRNTLERSSKETFDMYTALSLCHLWNIDVSYLFAAPNVKETAMPSIKELTTGADGKFVVLTDEHYTKKYSGYIYSSNTNKCKDRIQFELNIEKFGSSAKATLTYKGAENDVRTFFGTPIHATKSNTIFILFTKPDGNYYIFCFNYKNYNHRDMYYRKGVALTTSSINDKPLVQSFVMFEKSVLPKYRDYVYGLLTVSDTQFYVSKQELEFLKDSDTKVSKFISTFAGLINQNEDTVYQISETQIFETLKMRQYRNVDKLEVMHALIKLKENSLCPEKIVYDDISAFAEFAKHMQGIATRGDEESEG